MHLAPTDEQQAVAHEARRFLDAELTRERRLEWDALPAGYDPAFWRAVAELGWLGFALPEKSGGQGASLLDLGLLVEECGRAVAPLALFAAWTGGLALQALGTPAQKKAWLPAIARGERQVALAVSERGAALEPSAMTTTVTRRGRNLVVHGEKDFVLQGVTADAFLVAGCDGRRGVSVVLVPRDAKGVTVTPLATFAKDRQSTVRLRQVALPADALCGTPATAWPRLEKLRRTFATLLCCDLIGGADTVLEMTVRYVGEREQFGAKLGTFQAVQQMVAVMAIELEGARHVARQALWRLAEGLPSEREIAIAKAWVGRAYREITLMAHQLHGGAGYVVEHPLHRHTLRAKQAELLFGSSEDWLDTLADQLRLAPRVA
ncbi:MAG: acyl-CoA/acyl-ACP dehydrogenase [bacterium]|nr:acyl-CoA/acyl-ACP dehydrogenase [bacterium]